MKFSILSILLFQFIIYFTMPLSVTCEEYDNDFISLLEMVYGEGLLSQWGINSIDQMFEGIDLKGLKLLDLGSGLGMYDIYLAKKHDIELVVVDPQESLVKRANITLEKHKNKLIGNVCFLLMKNPYNLNEFSDDLFDIVFSKESILHVPNEVKDAYFKEIYRVLKPSGKVLIMDWMHNSPIYGDNTRKIMEMDGLSFQLLMPLEYEGLLKRSRFEIIQFTDTTFHHEQLSQQNIDAIISLKEIIKIKFGEDVYNYSIESWGYQRDAFQSRELLTGIFKATKK